MKLLEIKNLSKNISFNKKIRFPDLTIGTDTFIFVNGVSGVGKSTLLKIISGIDNDYIGNITFFKDYKIGYFFSDFGLINEISILENMMLNSYSLLEGKNIFINKINTISNDLGLKLDIFKTPLGLSSGEYQRLCFLRSFLHNPNLLILDEVNNHLDEKNKNIINNKILELHKLSKTAIFFVSHDEKDFIFFKDNIKNGKFLFVNLNI